MHKALAFKAFSNSSFIQTILPSNPFGTFGVNQDAPLCCIIGAQAVNNAATQGRQSSFSIIKWHIVIIKWLAHPDCHGPF